VSTLIGALIGAMLAGGGAAGTAPTKAKLEPLASESLRKQAVAALAGLARPVRLVVFTRTVGNTHLNEPALGLARGLAELSSMLAVESHDLDADGDRADAMGVDKAPAIVVVGERDHGVRFCGVPGGRELEALLAAIRRVAARDSGLTDASRKALAALRVPVHIEVFVTLDCAYCSGAVAMAHQLAIESDKVVADMVEFSAFSDLGKAYGLRSVPTVLVNGKTASVGAKSESDFVASVVEAAATE